MSLILSTVKWNLLLKSLIRCDDNMAKQDDKFGIISLTKHLQKPETLRCVAYTPAIKVNGEPSSTEIYFHEFSAQENNTRILISLTSEYVRTPLELIVAIKQSVCQFIEFLTHGENVNQIYKSLDTQQFKESVKRIFTNIQTFVMIPEVDTPFIKLRVAIEPVPELHVERGDPMKWLIETSVITAFTGETFKEELITQAQNDYMASINNLFSLANDELARLTLKQTTLH